MWLSKQMTDTPENTASQVGRVTIGGDTGAVYTDSEKRNVVLFTPGGYVWRPSAGQDVMVMKTADGTNGAVGCLSEDIPAGFETGEVYIKSKTGASVWLKNDGRITLSGRVDIDGSLFINGNEIG